MTHRAVEDPADRAVGFDADAADPIDDGSLATDPRRWLALFVIGLSQLMVILDATITNIALPTATADLGIGPEGFSWVITAYALPFGALLLLGGRIADYVGRKKVLILSLCGFALASIIGGAAQAAWMMYAGRALQGVFGAMLAPAALSLITVTFTAAKDRAKAFAVFGAIAGGGAAVGLLLGGFLTEYLDSDAVAGWRWCFFVNIPIAVIAAILGVRILRESRSSVRGHYDLPGALTATLGLGALVWGFTRPTERKSDGSLVGWASFETIGWIGGAIVLLALFVIIESRSANPLLPLRIVENRNRAAAYLVGLLVGAGMFALFLFITLYLQDWIHFNPQAVAANGGKNPDAYSPMQTGLAYLPFSAGIVVGAGVGSQLVLRIGPKWVIAVGALLGMIGMLWFSTMDLESSYFAHIMPAQIVMAVGMGFIFMSVTNLALVNIAPDDAGVASAVVNTVQQIGGSLGTALLTTVAFTSAATFAADRAATVTSPDAGALLQAQATVHGFGTGYFWAACFFLIGAVIAVTMINADKKDLANSNTGEAVHMG